MEQIFIKYLNEFSQNLIEKYGFSIKHEFNEEQSCFIEYSSANFIITIEKYFREFYVLLYKVNNIDKGIELNNLLEYLNQNENYTPYSRDFLKEKELEECYRKQFQEISTLFFDNYEKIDTFFNNNNFEEKFQIMEEYRQNKYPELYKRKT